MEIQNVQRWANRPEYEAWDAAFLICDFEPGTVEKGDSGYNLAKAIYRRLAVDIKPCLDTSRFEQKRIWATGKIKRVLIEGKKFYSKESLLEWCETFGYRPKFLFPDEISDLA